MSETSKSKNNIMYAIHSIIMIALTFGIGLLDPPSVGNITELGMDVLGVFLGALYGWIFIGFVWPSFFAMLVLGMTEYGTITQIFSAGFGDSSVVMIFFMFVFNRIFNKLVCKPENLCWTSMGIYVSVFSRNDYYFRCYQYVRWYRYSVVCNVQFI